MSAKTVWAIGTTIVCPNRQCSREIAILVRSYTEGDELKEQALEGIGREIRGGSGARCHYCDTPWAMKGKLHTHNGWNNGDS